MQVKATQPLAGSPSFTGGAGRLTAAAPDRKPALPSARRRALPALLPGVPRAPNGSWRRRPPAGGSAARPGARGGGGGVPPAAPPGDAGGAALPLPVTRVCKHCQAVGGAGSAAPASPVRKRGSGRSGGRRLAGCSLRVTSQLLQAPCVPVDG